MQEKSFLQHSKPLPLTTETLFITKHVDLEFHCILHEGLDVKCKSFGPNYCNNWHFPMKIYVTA